MSTNSIEWIIQINNDLQATCIQNTPRYYVIDQKAKAGLLEETRKKVSVTSGLHYSTTGKAADSWETKDSLTF